jgi:hypothetical protein
MSFFSNFAPKSSGTFDLKNTSAFYSISFIAFSYSLRVGFGSYFLGSYFFGSGVGAGVGI